MRDIPTAASSAMMGLVSVNRQAHTSAVVSWLRAIKAPNAQRDLFCRDVCGPELRALLLDGDEGQSSSQIGGLGRDVTAEVGHELCLNNIINKPERRTRLHRLQFYFNARFEKS
jgi:hypothetical protein